MTTKIEQLVRDLLPRSVRRQILRYTRWPPVRRVPFHNLRRLTPISRSWGGDRGLPIDRYYIERFLNTYADDIQNHVLEVGDNVYTRRFGGKRVTKSEVVHVRQGNPKATIVTDLACADNIPSSAFDCIICTQTLQQIFDIKAVVRTLFRLLKPGSVLLATFPGISQIDREAMNQWGDYWRFTTLSAKCLFEEAFPAENIEIKACGNVLAAVAFLHGLAAEEFHQEEIDYVDDDYQMLITVRAVKPEEVI